MPRRSTLRRIIWPCVALAGLVGLLWGLLMWPVILTPVVAWGLSRSTGTPVHVIDADWNGWGLLSVRSIRVTAPGWPGRAGELVTLEGFRSSFRPLALLVGRVELDDLQVDHAELHIAERPGAEDPDNINVRAIRPPSGGLSLTPTLRCSRITLGRLVVEKEIVRGEAVELQGRNRAFRGNLRARGVAEPGQLDFELVEIEHAERDAKAAADSVQDGVRMTGTWNDTTFAYALEANRLDFSDTVRPLLPLALQRSCDALGLRGTVSDISVSGWPERPIAEASLRISNVAVNLMKVDLPVKWSRFSEGRRGEVVGRPRMAVDSGTIVLRHDRLSLQDFRGKLVSVTETGRVDDTVNERPITVPLPAQMTMDLDFSGLRPPAGLEDAQTWFDDALLHCGVDIRFAVPDFALLRSRPDRAWAVEMPEQIVNVLENFRVQKGHIEIAATAHRDPSPVGQPPADFDVAGTLRIRDGQGSYVNFAYPLRDVEAEIGFRGETMQVRSLTATGSDHCRMMISGTVDGTGDDAGVNLTVETATPAPIDLALQNAFDPGPRRIFELLFAREMRDSLVRSGLLANDPSTELGGQCRFQIRVQRERGGGSKVATTGWIGVTDANVLCSRFPYPIHVDRGRIELDDEAIRLPKGEWLFRTAGGGTGTIHGKVGIPRLAEGGRDARPDVTLQVADDHINPLLLAAIPVEDWERGGTGRPGWPGSQWSTAAQSLRALQLEGELAIDGTIGSDAAGSTTLDLGLLLVKGAFRPRNGPDRLLEASGLPWPAGFDLDDVRATVHLTEREARLLSMQGKAGGGSVSATGRASLQRRDRELHAQLSSAPLGLWLAPLLPADVRESAAETWRRCQASGTFDGDIDVRQDASGADLRHAVFTTPGVRFVSDGVPCEMRVPCGYLSIDGPTLRLTGLEVTALSDGRTVGTLEADGSLALQRGGVQGLAGRWNVASLASPFWPALLRAANLPDLARLHADWNPAGEAAGELAVRSALPGQADWSLQVDEGAVVIGDPAGVPIAMELLPGARLEVGPGTLGLHAAPGDTRPALSGRLPGGGFSLDGEIAIGPGGPADGGAMQLAFDFGPLDDAVTGVLPASLAEGLRTVRLRAANASSDRLRLLGWTAAAPSPGLTGGILLQDASMQAGTELSRIHARFGIDAREGRPDPVVVDLGGGQATFMVKDRVLESVGGTLRIAEGARRIEIRDLQGTIYGGRAWAQASIGGERRDWRLEVGMAGASLPGLIRGGASTNVFANRGDVNAWLSLGGDLDRDGSLRGVGRLEATHARMGELPLTLRLLQATQLMLPLADSLDTAEVGFHVHGNELRFERFDLACPTLKLLGTGSMDLSNWNVALRFRNRGTVPLLSDLFGVASDTLFVIDVKGPASDPSVQLTPLPPLGQDPSTQPLPPHVAAASPEKP